VKSDHAVSYTELRRVCSDVGYGRHFFCMERQEENVQIRKLLGLASVSLVIKTVWAKTVCACWG